MTNPVDVSIALEPWAQFPSKGTEDAAGWDIYANLRTSHGNPSTLMIARNDVRLVPTGLRISAAGPVLVLPRSGLAKSGVLIANSPGLIDPDYRGEIKVLLTYVGSETAYYVRDGDRIGQLYSPFGIRMRHVEEILINTKRGEGGFGSTGR